MKRQFIQKGIFGPKDGREKNASLLSKTLEKQENIFRKLETVEYVFRPEFASLVNFSQGRDAPIHRWFKYREGYSPDLIHAFFDVDEKRILDPFCGSGTALVCAKQKGIDSVGVDINILSTFVSKVKTYDFQAYHLAELRELMKSITIADVEPVDPPKLKIIGNIFPDDVLDYLLRMKTEINLVKNEKLRNTLFLGWLAILEIVSNTKKEGNGIKYRSTRRTKRGYVRVPRPVWERKYYGKDKLSFVRKKMQSQLNMMFDDISRYCISSPQTIVELFTSDSTRLSEVLGKEEFSLAIFSPPYANCFDYFEIFKVELWMGGFAKSYEEIRKLRRNAIGTLWQKPSFHETSLEELEEILGLFEDRRLWDKKIIPMLVAYFNNMEIVLRHIYDMLMPNRKCVIVVGNSAYSNIIIPTDLLLARIGARVGFKKAKIIFARHLTTSSQQKRKLEQLKDYLRETIIVLKK